MFASKWPKVDGGRLHVGHHAIHLDLLQNAVLFEEDLHPHWCQVHEKEARAEPQDAFSEVANHRVERVRKVNYGLPDRDVLALEDLAVWVPALTLLCWALLSASEMVKELGAYFY